MVFVPVHGGFASVAGKVIRPAIYELRPDETLRDAIAFAGGFDPSAVQARVTIHRILPPDSRGPGGRARVVVAVGADQFTGGVAPAVPMAPGDSVTVYAVADRQRGYVTVRGNVWVEGEVGFTPGMKLSDAIRLAGGPGPTSICRRILVTRMRDDSSFVQLRSAFADSTGRVRDDLALEDEDEVRIFSRTTFRPERYVADRGRGAPAGPGAVPRGDDDAGRHPPGRRAHRGRAAARPRSPGSRPSGRRGRWPRRCACRSTRRSSSAGAAPGADGATGAGPRRRRAAPALRQRPGAAAGRLGRSSAPWPSAGR